MSFLEDLFIAFWDFWPALGRFLLDLLATFWEGFLVFARELWEFAEIQLSNFIASRLIVTALDFIFRYWTEELILLALALLFLAHKIFPRWKEHHLASYALAEIAVGTLAIASALPWPHLLDLARYADLLTLTAAAKIAAGIYTGVRGEENLRRARTPPVNEA